MSPVQEVSQVDEFNTIYDFGGLPEALYRIQYPAKGSEPLSKEIEENCLLRMVSRMKWTQTVDSRPWSLGGPSDALSGC